MTTIFEQEDCTSSSESMDVNTRSDFPTDSLSNSAFVSNMAFQDESQQNIHSKKRRAEIDPNDALGMITIAPTIETVVVTTTTTTTTKLPPFRLPGPRHGLDTKQYPLAATPTPSALKNISFKLDGKRTIFREAEDATFALEQFQQESQQLQKSNGTIKTVRASTSQPKTTFPALSRSFTPRPAVEPRKRPVSPVPGLHRRKRHVKYESSATEDNFDDSEFLESRKQSPHTLRSRDSSPATPPTSQKHINETRSKLRSQSAAEGHDPRMSGGSSFDISDSAMGESSFGDKPPRAEARHLRRLRTTALSTPLSSRPHITQTYASQSLLPENVVPTPPIQEDEPNLFGRQSLRNGLSSIPSRLTTVDSATGQDGSLPSPSLSPVTAAANLRHSGYFADTDSSSEPTLQQDNDVEDLGVYLSETPSRTSMVTARQSPAHDYARDFLDQMPARSFNDIPAMLDFFEAIPDEFKSWVMHQLLRRCPKPTLQLVADVVNPALKCDFLSMLPLELSLNILKYLDVQSLCRASQVSKKWRHIINGDEKAWKELFDRDGYVLPEGELQRAILEGWGWQDPSGPNGCERDISGSPQKGSDSDISRPTTPLPPSVQRQTLNALAGTSSRRPKRKAATRLSNRNKQAKRKDAMQEEADLLHPAALLDQFSNIEGPYNAANAASLAVPYPQVEVPSLKDLHLYKSLYRRHHLIRKSWMQDDIKPRHIAFRAHDRHVVTCLQFDTDKIITGSDDTNINVYDTKTGKLRARLQGHEGGVWALQYEGNILVSGSTDRSVRVWDIEKGRQMQVFQGHTSTVRCLQILLPTKVGETADGKPIMMPKQPLIITGSRDSNLRVWKLPQPGDPYYYQAGPPQEDTDCPYFVRILSGHQHSVRAIAAHADTLISGSYDSTVRVWKISTGEVIHRLQGHSQKVYSVVLDHSRNRCISGSMDNLVKIWSLDTGTCLYTLEGHTSLVGLLDLNSERLVSAAADATLRIWDPENGQCKANLSAHTGAITCFQHDGQKVISGSDRTLKMWNVKTGECAKDLLTDLSGVWQVKFNERRCVAAVQRDNMTYVEVLDFGASRDGVPEDKRGRRIVVDVNGEEIPDPAEGALDLEPDPMEEV